MVDKEMISAISDLLDTKLKPIAQETAELKKTTAKLEQKMVKLEKETAKLAQTTTELGATTVQLEQKIIRLSDEMRYVRVVQLENNVIPRLNTMESCYLDTSKRYLERTDQIDTMQADVDMLKLTVEDHSKRLQMIS